MRFSVISALAALTSLTSAYTVTTPSLNSTLHKGSKFTVKWTSVDTDPTTFSLYLTNFQTAHWPPTVLSLAQGISRDAGSVDVKIPCDVSSDYGWQFNFINGTNTYVIYAQSQVFALTGDCVDSHPTTTAAPVSAYPTGYANATYTLTTTAIQTIETVVYQTPVVWFVQPTNLVAAAAICPPAAQQTVTVTVNNPAATCGSGAGYPGVSPPAGGAYTNNTGAGYPANVLTSTGGYSVVPTTAAPSSPQYTGAASSVKVGGFLGAAAAAVALLL